MLSAETKAILLLSCPLLGPSGGEGQKVLTPTKYRNLIQECVAGNIGLAELVEPDFERRVKSLSSHIDHDHVISLLSRGFQLSQVLDSWARQNFWVTTKYENGYPAKLSEKLKESAPPYVIGVGSKEIFDDLSFGVVGSRDLSEEKLELARSYGRIAANENVPIVSGFARGADQAAMFESVSRGGRAIGVLADKMSKAAISADTREWIHNDQLTFITTYDPNASFNVGNAMQRNKFIYALSDAVLVVDTKENEGGTWAGAQEQLKKLHYAPVYTEQGVNSEGLAALRRLGATDISNQDLNLKIRDFLSTLPIQLEIEEIVLPKQLGLFE